MKPVTAVLGIGIALSLTIGARAATAQAAQAADGEALYRQHCRTCHGATGAPSQRMVGLYPALKSFADTATLASISADSIVAILKNGKGKDMKSFKDKLTPDQMALVARYVKTLAHAPAKAP